MDETIRKGGKETVTTEGRDIYSVIPWKASI